MGVVVSGPAARCAVAGVSAANDNGKLSGLALYDNPADPDGGFGYRVAAGWEDGGRFQGEANWIGPRIALDGGVSLDHGVASLRADASGALVFLRGSLFAAHDPGGAVALVKTGEPGIHIYRENRPVAVSDGEPSATRLAAQAKRLATDTGFEVVNGCLQLHGGYGYLRDHPIERVLRDVRVHQILEGTNEIMRLIVSRAMLGN